MKKTNLSIGLAAFLPTAAFAALPTPVHHWTFDTDGSDSGSGGIAMQFNGNGTHDPAFSRSGGGSINLDPSLSAAGATSVSPVDISGFSPGQIRTIAFWMKGPAGQAANATMVGLGVNAYGERFDIRTTGGTNLRVEIQGAGQATTTPVADNEWHHVAVVVPDVSPATDTLLGDVLFYVDGVSVANTNAQTQVMNTATAVVRLGDSVVDGANREYRGWLDDVRIYSEALDITQIVELVAEADSGGPSASGFAAEDDSLILGDATDLIWDAFALGAGDTLQITNDQDATIIDAKALTGGITGTSGITATPLSPTATTIYSLELNSTVVATTTVNVQTTPDILTFTASPDKIIGFGDSTLSWTTGGAARLVINDGTTDIATYTASANTQAFLDAGTLDVTGITADTTFTLSGWLDEPGAGDAADLTATVTVQPGPDLTLVATPTVFSGPTDVTLFFNATVSEVLSTVAGSESTITFFNDDGDPNNGFDLVDDTADFDTLLGVSTPGVYFLEPLIDGINLGSTTSILSWSGDALVVADDFGGDFTWNGDYRINTVSFSGADMLVINDGASDIFTTTDPLVIQNGSYTVTGVSADTTFTATASISGAGSTMAAVSVDADGTGSSYEEVVLADGPLGYYPCNENSTSSVVYDHSGNNNSSVSLIGSLTLGETGALGTAHRFNGNETITTGVTLDPSDPDGDGSGSADLDQKEGFTLEALIRPDDASTGVVQHILSNQDGSLGPGRSDLYLAGSGAVTSFYGGRSQFSEAFGLDASWCHVVQTVTYDAARDLYVERVYLDGVLMDTIDLVTGTGVSAPPESANGNWVIGSHKLRQINTFWIGLLDEIAIYDYPLDDPNQDGDLSDSRVAAHNDAFLANAVGLLAFERSDLVLRDAPYDLYYKVGGASTAAVINPGGITVTPGTSGNTTVTPSVDTTYTLDVDGDTKSVTLQVFDELFVMDFGTDNGGGYPFVEAEGLTTDFTYQLFFSTNLQNWSATGTPVVGDGSGTATFLDGSLFDPVARPERHYRVQVTAGPPVGP